jgi:V8-like Glu-specific endopeptidase
MRLNARLQAVAAALTAVSAATVIASAAAPAATASTARPAGVAGGTSAAGAAGHAAAVTIAQQRAVLRYWTRSRMEHAVPLGPATSALRAAAGAVTQPVSGLLGTGAVSALPLPTPLSSLVPPLRFLAAPARVAPVAPAARALRAAATRRAGGRTTSAQWQGGGAVARTTGKIFFTLSGTDYVCSGSSVASANSDVAVTAGHCVTDGSGNWATNWTFVPGYSNGNAPYGSFTARRFFVASQWTTSANEDYDVAFAALNTASPDGVPVHVVSAVGGMGVAFGTQEGQVDAFGYPSEPPYNGASLYYCAGGTSPDPYHATSDMGLDCAMTEGSSGGPWLSGFNGSTGVGTITSVSSFKYDDSSNMMYGTTFGASARSLYNQAARA